MPEYDLEDQIKTGAYQMKMWNKIQQGGMPTEEEIKEFAKLKGYTFEEAEIVLENMIPYNEEEHEKRTYKGILVSELKGKDKDNYYNLAQEKKKKLDEIQWRDEGSIGKNPSKKKNIFLRIISWIGDVGAWIIELIIDIF